MSPGANPADLRDVMKSIMVQHGRLAEVEQQIKNFEGRKRTLEGSIEYLQARFEALKLVEKSKG